MKTTHPIKLLALAAFTFGGLAFAVWAVNQ